MRVFDAANGFVAVEPVEGAGTISEYFRLQRLAGAGLPPSDQTWSPLLEANPLHLDPQLSQRVTHQGGLGPQWRARLQAWAREIYDEGRPEAGFAAVSAELRSLERHQVPPFLTAHARNLLGAYPDGSFWFVRTDELLIRRMAMQRTLLMGSLVPDLLDHNDVEGRSLPPLLTLQGQSLTRAASFAKLIDPLLLAFSPASLGFAFDWMPHSLVFLNGFAASLVRKYPQTPWSPYEPSFSPIGPQSWKSAFVVDLTRGEIESLLGWWVGRLNVIYSHLADPTGFHDRFNRHRPNLQTACLLTVERLLADFLLVQCGVQGPEIARQQAAFDLLDKSEALLGFGSNRTGKGFERLLRRRSMIARLDEVWSRLPLQVQPRFRAHTRVIFDSFYEGALEHSSEHRRTRSGVRVAKADGSLYSVSLETYVPRLARAIRNSAHGFIDSLTNPMMSADRSLLATHDGVLPPQFCDLAALIALALVADFERVVEGSWLPRP